MIIQMQKMGFLLIYVKGLKGDADNGDKVITVGELHDYIRKMFLILLKIFILTCHRLLSYILKILIEYYYDCHSIDSQKI